MLSERYYTGGYSREAFLKGLAGAVALADRLGLLIDIMKVFTIAEVSKNNNRGGLQYWSFSEIK